MTRRLSENDRDTRDLRILQLLDEGMSQDRAARTMGVSRGPVARMVAEIRADEASQ